MRILRLNLQVCVVVAVALLVWLPMPLMAQTMTTLDEDLRGWVDSTGYYLTSNTNYAAGHDGGLEYRNFFIFDLSSVTGTIVDAELRLDNPTYQGTGGDYTVREVNSAPSVFFNGQTTQATFDDLGTGTVIALMSPSQYTDPVVYITLNADGLAYLNANIGNQVIFGGRNTGLNTYLFANTHFPSVLSQLTLTTIVNDAPVVTPGTVALTDIDEDPLINDGDEVDTFIYSVASDPDGDDLGIAIIDADQSNGQWEFSIDGGLSWNPIGNVAEDEARLVSDEGFVRFSPNANWYGTVDFEFRAWDQTQGTNGDVDDTTNNGGATPFSIETAMAELVVHPVNDPPQHSFPATAQTFESKPLAFAGGYAITVSDVDIYDDDLSTQVSVTVGDLVVAEAHASLIAGGANGSASVTLVGHIDDVNAALAELRWVPESGFVGATQLELFSDDGGASGQGGPQSATDFVSLEVLAAPDIRVRHGSTPVEFDAEYSPSSIPGGLMRLTIRNNGSVALNLTGAEPVEVVELENASVEIVEQPATGPVAAGEQVQFDLQVVGDTTGEIHFAVSIANDDPLYAPFTFTVVTHTSALAVVSAGRGCATSTAAATRYYIALPLLLLMLGLIVLRRRHLGRWHETSQASASTRG